MLLLVSFLLLFKIINAIDYKVTVKNDANLPQGAVHTWLAFDSSNSDTKYFSFEAVSMYDVAKGIDSSGKCTEKSHIENRTPSKSAVIEITKEQYDKLIASSLAFCANQPVYDLIPNNQEDHLDVEMRYRPYREDFNCVTASNKILLNANIDLLVNAKTPYDVEAMFNKKEGGVVRKVGIGVFGYLRRMPYMIYDTVIDPRPFGNNMG